MPWKTLTEVPDNLKSLDGANLTLGQVNWIANIADNAEGGNGWAIAKAQFKKEFQKSDDGSRWVRKPAAATRDAYLKRMAATNALLLSLHLTSETTDGLVWVEACMRLDFEDENGRHVKITEDDLKTLKRHFDEQVVGRDVFVDIDHMAARAHDSDPRSRARIGVVKKVRLGVSKNEFTEGEPTLLCGIQFNKRGKEYLANDEFGYVSAVIHRTWKDRRPKHQDELVKGPVMSSITLTNDQFVPWLAPVGEDVTDRFAASRAVVIEQNTAYLSASGGEVTTYMLTALAGESADDLRDRLQGVLHKTLGLAEDEHVWPKDVQVESDVSGVVIYEYADKQEGREYTLSEDGSISLGDAFEVKHVWEKVGEGGAEKELKDQELDRAAEMLQWQVPPPEGWTEESKRKLWNSLTAGAEHKITACMNKVSGHVSDPGAFCASLGRSVGYTPTRSTRKDKQGDEDMETVETLTRKVEELEAKAKENSEELTKVREDLKTAESKDKKNSKEVLRLKRQTLMGKFERVIELLKRPNSKGRVLPPAVTKRYERLVRQALTGTPEDEEDKKITLQDTAEQAKPAEGAPTEMAEAVAEVAQEVAAQAEETAEEIATDASKTEEVKEAQVAGLLIEMATELEKVKELETVEPEAKTTTASRKPSGENLSEGDLISARAKEILARKEEGQPKSLLRCKSYSTKYAEAIRLARVELVTEGVIET